MRKRGKMGMKKVMRMEAKEKEKEDKGMKERSREDKKGRKGGRKEKDKN